MELYILRHAEAEPRGSGPDRERALTDKGRDQCRRVAKFLKRNELVPDVILSSPFTRAWQTAEIVCDDAGLDDATLAEWLSSGVTPETALKELSAFARLPDLMIVGHQPDLGLLAAFLLGIRDGDQIRLRKGALLGLELEALQPGAAKLLFSVPVQMMG